MGVPAQRMPSPLTLPRAPLMEVAPWKKRRAVWAGAGDEELERVGGGRGWPLGEARAGGGGGVGAAADGGGAVAAGALDGGASQKEATEPPLVPRKVAPRMSSLAKK